VMLPLAYAADLPVDLKADYLKYRQDDGVVEARGRVLVSVEGFTIQAEQLLINLNQNVMTAEGHVILGADTYSADAKNFTYRISDEVASIGYFNSVISPSELKGKVYLKASQVHDRADQFDGLEGSVTTCNLDHPHYHSLAQKVEYYPDDKIVGYNVTFYVNDVPVMWMPYLVYPLKKRRGKMPVTGYNDVEGFFIKTSWDYFLNQGAYGLLFLDYMDKKGFGYGVEDNYKLNEKNSGRFYVYHVEERDTGKSDWVVKLDHKYKLNPTTNLSYGLDISSIYLVPSGYRDRTINLLKLTHNSEHKLDIRLATQDDRVALQQNYDFSVLHKYESYVTDFYYSVRRSNIEPHWNYLSTRINHSQDLFSDSLKLRISAPYYYNVTSEGIQGDARLEPAIELTNTGVLPVLGAYSLRYYENWYIDPDGPLYMLDSADQYVEKLPEISLSLAGYQFPLADLSTAFSYGYYHEVKYVDALGRNRDFSAQRASATITAAKTFPLGWGTSFLYRESISQYLYGPGDARYQLNEYAGLHTHSGVLTNWLDFNRAYAEGNTPFYFDQQYSFASNVKERLTLDYDSKVVWNLWGGYNFLAAVYDNVNTDLTLSPNQKVKLTFKGGFDIQNQRYLDLTTLLTVFPWDRFQASLNNVYDLNYGYLKSANSAEEITIGNCWQNTWGFRSTQSYDYFTQLYQLRELSIIKDLHCWEAKYSYSDYRKEHTLTLTLKALPDQPMGWSTGKGFFYEGFDRAFDSIKSDFFKDSPSRI